MDGFFEKYGRMIIIAVAICFVLLYLTPMRNVIGSSVNGFAGNFANKVGESLGTVKMPDGSGGATNSEGVKVGDILDIEGTKYVVLEQKENSQALVITASSIGERAFQSSDDDRVDGQKFNTYQDSEIDNYLENSWYNGLSSTMKAAVQTTSIKQVSYTTLADPDSKQETGYNGQVYNTISRHVFLPSVSEIGKVVDLENKNKVKTFLNGDLLWTRDSYHGDSIAAMFLAGDFGDLYSNIVDHAMDVRPTFTVDLSKIDYKVAGHTDYK